MGKLISSCPNCNTVNEVNTFNFYMHEDEGTAVVCTKCFLRFRATLSRKDTEELFDVMHPLFPRVEGDKDHVLESCKYPE